MDRNLPKPGAAGYRVRTIRVATFRRAGVEFDSKWKYVDASNLTAEQHVELLNTHTLEVEEVSAKDLADALVQSKAAPAADDDEGKAKKEKGKK